MMTRFRTGAALVAVVGVVSSAPTPARAQATPEQKKKAKEHYEKGTTHYNLGRFDEAIDEFTKAFELYPEPVFLYNIAQAYRMKENWERAKFFYKRYLSLSPNAANRADVESRIAEVDAELQKAKAGGGTPAGGGGTTGTPAGGGGPTTGGGTTGTPAGGGTTGGGATGGGTPAGGGGQTTTGGGTTGTGSGGDVAAGGTTGGTEAGGSVIPGGDGGVLMEYHREKPIRLAVSAGPAFVGLGGGPDVPVQAAFAIDGGYLFTRGKLGLGGGLALGYTPIPYEPDGAGEAGTAGLVNLAFLGQAAYALGRKLDLRAEAGLGVTWFTGLGEANPFTNDAQAATGPVPMFTLRVGLGVDLDLGGGLRATVSPIVFSRSSGPKNIDDKINHIQQIDILFGLGYSL